MIVQADARRIPLAYETVQCVVTSPPYWGLRKYSGEQELTWGGAEGCTHNWIDTVVKGQTGGRNQGSKSDDPGGCTYRPQESAIIGSCACGAWRGAFGLEPTIEMYVQHTVLILREIRRVLRKDGVCFWNIADSYARDPKKGDRSGYLGLHKNIAESGCHVASQSRGMDGLKPKDLCLIPERVAIAAQHDGWWVRSMIIWAKPNPMPESVTDRPTDAYEHIIMLTKSERYFWDADAVREPWTCNRGDMREKGVRTGLAYLQQEPIASNDSIPPSHRGSKFTTGKTAAAHDNTGEGPRHDNPNGRNLRNVWTFPTQPYSGAHFATFPEEIPRRCIRAASKVGDLVLDPFGGSGTTARVAIELNRNPIMLDLSYHELADKRTRNVQRELIRS